MDATLASSALHVASAEASLQQLEDGLDTSGSVDEESLHQILAATSQLHAAFRFIDELESGIAAASELIEATERRLEVAERGEALPESLAQLPPPMFTAHQFIRRIRKHEHPAPPELPELKVLPPSRSSAVAAQAQHSTSATGLMGVDALLGTAADEVQRLARTAASRAAPIADRAIDGALTLIKSWQPP